MSFNLKLDTEKDIKIELGQTKEELIHNLEQLKLRYIISFDKTDENNIKNTMIDIPSLRIETTLKNDILVYIKSGSNDGSQLFSMYNVGQTEALNKIKEEVRQRFKLGSANMLIEKMNFKTMDTIMIITMGDKKQVKVHILKDMRDNVYVNTLRYLG